MSAVLDGLHEAARLVHGDLVGRGRHRIDPNTGRDGMAAEQVLRAFVLKQMNDFSYEELAFHLADSNTYRAFCRAPDDAPRGAEAYGKGVAEEGS